MKWAVEIKRSEEKILPRCKKIISFTNFLCSNLSIETLKSPPEKKAEKTNKNVLLKRERDENR